MDDKALIVVLAISPTEACEMVEAIRAVRENVTVQVVAAPHEIPPACDEFVMSEGFQRQRSVRMLLGAIQSQGASR